tara:strand:+ start:50 stop:499 length:450 start_codon:yes stop_codon:yes gene_type:complete
MADKKISQLSAATALQGDETFAVVQSSTTKKADIHSVRNFIIATNLTVSSGDTVNLSDSTYANAFLIKLTWSGGSGNMTLNLPSAASNTNRALRFISDTSFNTNTRVYLTPNGGDTLDGSTNFYEINKEYEGIKVWSDGSEWFIIQKKA